MIYVALCLLSRHSMIGPEIPCSRVCHDGQLTVRPAASAVRASRTTRTAGLRPPPRRLTVKTDFALVLLDEAETPRHHRSHLAAA
jgi:hypothetical protein